MISNKDVKSIIRNSLGLEQKSRVDEALVAQTKTYDLKTEFLSGKNKQAHKELYESYVENFNKISAELDTADRDNASANHSQFRSLKIDETYNMNALYQHIYSYHEI